MKRRVLAFLMAMILLVSSVPTEVFATTTEGEADTQMYFIDDTLWVPEGEVPSAPVVETGEWVKTEETMTESQMVCSVAEHAHGEECYQQTTKVKWTVALKEDSYASFAEDDGERLPICFFVTTLDQAQSAMGTYQNFKKTSWGDNGGGATDTAGAYAVADILELAPVIKSQTGIRANLVEDEIIRYVAQWPNGGTAEDFRKLDKDYQFNRVTYSKDEYEVQWVTICWRNDSSSTRWQRCGCGSNYDHIHIDGILTKKVEVESDTLTLLKEIPVQDEDQTFSFTLYQLQLDGNYRPTDQTVGEGIPMTATVPAGQTTANIVPVDPDATINSGHYYKLVENPSDKWMPDGVKIGNTASANASNIYIHLNTNGTIQYSTSYAYNTYKDADSASVVNKLIPSTRIEVTKVWNDGQNRDGLRPENVTVHLLKGNSHYGAPVTLSEANNWTAAWEVPETDFYGNEISYHVEEVEVAGYSSSVSGNAEEGFVVTNTHVLERTAVFAQKVWQDDNDRDGIRPHGVKVQLYCNGEAVTSYTDAAGNAVSGIAILTEAGSWSHEWLGLLKNGTDGSNTYTVKEIGYVDEDGQTVENPGYTVAEGKDADTGVLLITNTRQSATMDIPVEKVWSDGQNQDGLRPASVTVTLTANGQTTGKTLTLNEGNNWAGVFENVYVNANGTPIHYAVVETPVENYSTVITGNSAEGFVVTNSHEPAKTSVPVTKVWDDNNDQDGIRPESVRVQLLADGVALEGRTLTLDSGNNWSGSFGDLPKYKSGAEGQEVVYSLEEIGHTDLDDAGQPVYTAKVPEGYTVSVNGSTITNTHTPMTAKLTVEKVWNDENDQDGIRPDAVEITLHANGIPLLKDSQGNLVFEKVEDESGYTRLVLILHEGNDWTGSWENMPRFRNGQRISYTTVETGHYDHYAEGGENDRVGEIPEGYTVEHAYEGQTTEHGKATVTNIHVPATTDLNVQKVWDDDDNRAGLRPGSITVTLWQKIGGEWSEVKDAQGNPITKVLSPDNEWDDTFLGLPAYSGGEKIIYNVVETALDEALGYEEPTYSVDETLRVLTVTNIRSAEKISVTVNKVWEDEGNRDNVRPEAVTVTLYANGVDAQVSKELNAANGWTATFDNLYKHYNGKTVNYSVVETAVEGYTTGYTKSTDASGNVMVEVKNTHVPEVISIPVTKSWDDDNDRDGLRPGYVEVTLQQKVDGQWVDVLDGEGNVRKLTLTDSGNWYGSFDALPKYQSGAVGQKIEYRLVETAINGYNGDEILEIAVVDGVAAITNVHAPETVTITATKNWEDKDNQDGLRPESVILHLTANGKHTQKTITLDGEVDENGETAPWTATWTGLVKFEEGKQINYAVSEEESRELKDNGYSVSYSQTTDTDYVVTNTRNVNKTSFTVQKIWDDANNQDDVRYFRVAVQLYANGEAYGDPVELDAEGHWRYTWTDLNVNKAGQAITYTVEEVYYLDTAGEKVDLNETLYTEGTPAVDQQTGITTITNTHEVEKTSVSVRKDWNDGENRDGIRPASATVELYLNGEATGKYLELNAGNNWSGSFTGLDVHHGIGVDNVYTVVEVIPAAGEEGATGYQTGTPDGYTAAYDADTDGTLVVTNTHVPAVVTIPVVKNWDDANDQDGKRPASIKLQLYANGVALDGQVLILNTGNNWSGSFENLLKYEDGREITYTVEEAAISGYNVVNGEEQPVKAGVVDGKFTITNVHEVEKTTVTAKKVWEDNEDQDNKRPASITLNLFADNVNTGRTIVLDGTVDENGEVAAWTASWTGLDKYKNGQEIRYTARETITEEMTNAGYSVNYARASDDTLVVTNTRHQTDKTSFTVQKIWEDAENQDGKRPHGIVVSLFANGKYLDRTVLTADSNWQHTWAGLEKNEAGTAIGYTVEEVGYYLTKEDANALGEPEELSGLGYTSVVSGAVITNSRAVETIKVTVTKIWNDQNDQDDIQPDTVTVELYCNNQATGKTAELNAQNGWAAEFSGLDKNYGHGIANVYTVVETEVPGYQVEYASAKDPATGDIALTVSNTHIPEVISIPVMKVWDDANDQDGIRPHSVTVTLQKLVKTAEEEEPEWVDVEELTLTASVNWRGSFENLPKNSSGEVIQYRIVEEAVAGYRADYGEAAYPDADGDVKITNVHTPEVTTITAAKIWEDNSNQDGKRPASIVLHLLRNGAHTGMAITLDGTADETGESAAWQAQWTNLPKFEEGKEINYTIYEQRTDENGNALQWVKDGYISSNLRNGNDVTITNTRAIETTSFSAQKIWSDANNQDNVRYPGVAVQLFADEVAYGEPVVLTADGSWRHTWTGLDRNKDAGTAIRYTVKEIYYLDNEGSPVELSETLYTEGEPVVDEHTGITTITNTHAVETTELTVRKDWNDTDNQDGYRPESVTVQLKRNGYAFGDVVELNKDNQWEHTWTGLHVHHGIGIDNVYTVEEVVIVGVDSHNDPVYAAGAPEHYTEAYGTDSGVLVITNTHMPDVISVPVTKVWDDNNDQDGIRPESVRVQLLADGVALEGRTLTLDSGNNWSGSFGDLPKYKSGAEGQEVVYSLEEIGHTDLDDAGQPVYTAKVPEGYTVSVNGSTITNTHTPMTAKLTVEKVWNDENDQDGIRPDAVEITLHANGIPLLKDSQGNLVFEKVEDESGYTRLVLILHEGNDWTGSWENMPRFRNGQRISYTTVETGHYDHYAEGGENDRVGEIPEGYTVEHAYEGQTTEHGKATVTNSYTPDLTDLNVQKVWDDDDNRAGMRPDSVTVTLYADGVSTGKTAVLSKDNEWDATFSGLAKFRDGGVPIVYSVVEAAVEGYETSYSNVLTETIGAQELPRVVAVINTRGAEKIDVSVTKAWDDADDQDGMRPDEIEVTLYANGIQTGETRVLKVENGTWSTAVFEDLYRHYKGSEVVYNVVETPVDGYTAHYTSGEAQADGSFTIQVKNVHAPEKISIPVTKLWEDADNQDGIRPASVKVHLYADGEPTGMTAMLSADKNWTDNESFVNLDKFANGKAIVYTVVEDTVAGYAVKAGSNSVNGQGIIELVNVHEPEVTEVTVTKIWDDDSDRDGKRPEQITLHLLANGDHTGATIVLDGKADNAGEAEPWVARWTGVPKFISGQEIVYTVYEEMEAAEGVREIGEYIPSTTFDPENWNNITLTNSYQPEQTQISVLKVWDDNSDRDGLRAEVVEVKLLADGVDTGKRLQLDAQNNWAGQWSGLNKYRDHGVEIRYTVEETKVPEGYEADIVCDEEFAGHVFIITNTHESATTGVSVQKIWNDEEDNDGMRPDGIIVQLYANGAAVEGAEVLLNEMNNWTHVWHEANGKPLYVFDRGEKVSYYVDEIGYMIGDEEFEHLPEGYEKDLATDSYSTTITNTYVTEKISVTVEKVWVDAGDNDGFRPESVTVTLYRNGEAMDTVALNEENSWKHVWEDLYRYASGQEIQYAVKETEVAEYDATYECKAEADGSIHWTVTNTHQAKTKEMTVSKVWVDKGNAEQYRPDSVTVQLYKNGKAYGDVITLSAKNGWKHPVTLPMYEDGQLIVWTVAETKIPKYYSASYDQTTLTVTNTIQSKEIPQTGDDSQLSLRIGVVMLSCAGIAILLLNDRKRRQMK